MNFENQHAIITGGSSGIGKATAKLLAKEGANITIIARTQATLAAAKAEIEAARANPTQKVVAISADVSNREQIENAVQSAITQNGAPDLLFTYAGISHPGYFFNIPNDVFEQVMAINYFGTLYTIRAAASAMRERKQGHIVLMSSVAGLIGVYGYTTYCPTKFAVRGLAETLRGELKPFGIKVSIVYPPDTDTPQLHEENKIKPEETKKISGNVKPVSAESVAMAGIKGMQSGTFSITPGFEPSVIGRLHSLINPVLQWYFDDIVAKTAKSKV